MNNSVDSAEISEPQWFIQLKNNFKSLFFNENNTVEPETTTPTFSQTPTVDDQYLFKQPSEPASTNNKRKYQNQQHLTSDQMYTHRQPEPQQQHQQQDFNDNMSQYSSTQEKQRKPSYDMTVESTPVMYQLPVSSASDYTLNQNIQLTNTTIPVASATSLPSLNQVGNENYGNNNNELNSQSQYKSENDPNQYESVSEQIFLKKKFYGKVF